MVAYAAKSRTRFVSERGRIIEAAAEDRDELRVVQRVEPGATLELLVYEPIEETIFEPRAGGHIYDRGNRRQPM